MKEVERWDLFICIILGGCQKLKLVEDDVTASTI